MLRPASFEQADDCGVGMGVLGRIQSRHLIEVRLVSRVVFGSSVSGQAGHGASYSSPSADAGGLSAAANGDPVRQSQLSRQLKELEEFFGATPIERLRGHRNR